jgi:hypothetical protein
MIRHVCNHLLPLLPFLFFILCLHFSPHNTNSLFNQLLNDSWWLTHFKLWGACDWDTIARPHILSCSHRDTINLIPTGSISCSSLQLQSWIVFWMGLRVLHVFGTHADFILFLDKKNKQVKDMGKKTLV